MARGEGEGFGLKIDLDALVWAHLQKCASAFEAPEFESEERHTQAGGTKTSSGKVTLERFENAVLALHDLILPHWVAADNEKWPIREARYWGEKARYMKLRILFDKEIATWNTEGADPMKHPSRPLPPVEPKPFQEMVDDAYSPVTGWQVAVIQGTIEQAEQRDQERSETLGPIGSAGTQEDDTTLDKSILESSADN